MPTPGSQSIDRAAELLTRIIHSDGPISYTSLVESTGLARSTASRLLGALERNELVERTPEGGYRGGALFTHYAVRFDRVESLAAAAEPILESLAESTGETVNLGVPRGNTVVQVAQIDSSFIVGAANWVDVDVPAHCSALGKVMYAFGAINLPPGRLERRTPATIAGRSALHRELEVVRKQGYAITRGELEDGLDAVAAPVLDPGARVQASIGLSGPSFRFEGEHDELGKRLRGEAERLARVLARRTRVPREG